jgi:hypothetical protein
MMPKHRAPTHPGDILREEFLTGVASKGAADEDSPSGPSLRERAAAALLLMLRV